MRPAHRLLLTALFLAATGPDALAAPSVVATRPELDHDTGEAVLLVGGFDESGRSLKPSKIELVQEGGTTAAPKAAQSLADYATVASEGSQTWRPPVAVGLVYQWVEGVPSGILEGIHAYFHRLPSRTVVYPTVYGRLRRRHAPLRAAEISRLDDVPYLDGYRPNLTEAVRLGLADLSADASPLKVLLLVTDGRDFADPKGEGPGDLAALGRELVKARISLQIVSFPAPAADAAQSAANLRELEEASAGFHQHLEATADLENTLESVGQALADLQRIRFELPWSWRMFGGSHRVAVRLTVGNQRLTAQAGTLSVPSSPLLWGLLIGVLVLAAGVVVLVVLRRRGQTEEPPDEEAVLAAAHDLVRRGMPPERAAMELSRNFPDGIALLVDADPTVLSSPGFPHFRTRPGRARFQEIKTILAKNSSGQSGVSDALTAALAAALEANMPVASAADSVAARVAVEDWTAFVQLSVEQLAEALRASARKHPALGRPRARGQAMAIQDALRTRGGGGEVLTVGWLVRASGPGPRGETLRLTEGQAVVGQASSCALCILSDPAIAPEHAAITAEGGEFVVAPVGGEVKVEGKPVSRPHNLVDGETVEIGSCNYVFKSASTGSLSGGRRETRVRAATS